MNKDTKRRRERGKGKEWRIETESKRGMGQEIGRWGVGEGGG